MSSPVGTRGPDYEMVVERGKIAEFAAAMQSHNPAYAGPGAIAPPTFLISGSLWAPDGAAVDVGFDRRRSKRGGMMRFAVVVTEYRGEDGALVAEARRTLLETAPKGGAS